MNLDKLKNIECCDICQAKVVQQGLEANADGTPRQHCHGGTWQYLMFGCGRYARWSPQFDKVEYTDTCKHDPRRKIFLDQVQAVLTRLHEVVDASNLPDQAKADIHGQVRGTAFGMDCPSMWNGSSK